MQSSFKLILKSHFVGKCNLSKIQFALEVNLRSRIRFEFKNTFC